MIDDGSEDNTSEIVSRYQDPRIRYVKQANQERGAARNAGISLAQGSYITFLDSDDKAYPDHLETAYNFILENNHPEIFHVGYEIVDDRGSVLRRVDKLRNINQLIRWGNPLSCIGVYVRRETISAYRFNEERGLSGLEDWELWLRLSEHYSIHACNKVTAALLQHKDRSVMKVDAVNLMKKEKLFAKTIKSTISPSYRHEALAGIKTYTSLHLALCQAPKRDTLAYLINGIYINPKELLRRRTWVILKLLIFL